MHIGLETSDVDFVVYTAFARPACIRHVWGFCSAIVGFIAAVAITSGTSADTNTLLGAADDAAGIDIGVTDIIDARC